MAIINVTLNPDDMSTGFILSNGNLTATIITSNANIRATHGKTKGKWYWEVKLNDGSKVVLIGISNKLYPITSTSSTDPNIRAYYGNNGNKYPENTTYGTAWAVGDVIGVALDLDNGKLEFYKNGVSMGVSHTDLAGLGEVFPLIRSVDGISKTVTVNFGNTPFAYPMPSGFRAYNNYDVNKILILSNSKYKAIDYDDYINVVPILTSNNDSSGIVINRSTAWSADFEAYKAFDGLTSVSNRWQSASGVTSGWVSIDFKKSVKIYAYKVFNYDAINSRMAKDWTFEGSNDGVNWTVLDTQINQTAWQANEGRLYVLSTPSEYRFFRINISANNGDSTAVTIGELNLLTKNYLIKEIPTVIEQDFINHGMDKSTVLDLSQTMSRKSFVEKNTTTLGSGKVFSKSIDTTELPIKKLTIK